MIFCVKVILFFYVQWKYDQRLKYSIQLRIILERILKKPRGFVGYMIYCSL